MPLLLYKHGSYYGVFSYKGRKKWVKIGKVSKRDVKQLLKRLESKIAMDRLNNPLTISTLASKEPRGFLIFPFT